MNQIIYSPRFHSVSAYAACLSEAVNEWINAEPRYILSHSTTSGTSGMLTVTFLWLSEEDVQRFQDAMQQQGGGV